tara:strand:- start:5211 stop:5561 length:351 start_codon:yes stop_codon:yes gene_type:complete
MKKTREEIEAISLEKWPPHIISEVIMGINHTEDIFQETREAFIEGYTLCQEEDSKCGGAIPYEALSDGMKASIDSIESSLQCSSFEKDKYTSATQCRNCGREVWQHRQPLPTKPVV